MESQTYCIQLAAKGGDWPPVIRVRATSIEGSNAAGGYELKRNDATVGIIRGEIAAWWVECPPAQGAR